MFFLKLCGSPAASSSGFIALRTRAEPVLRNYDAHAHPKEGSCGPNTVANEKIVSEISRVEARPTFDAR
jgi:hypothetical protein